MRYPTYEQAAAEIIKAGQKLYDLGFVAANDGNISARISDTEVLSTPTGVSKGGMTGDMLVLLDLDGNVLEGKLRPSSEVKMHLAVYRADEGLRGVVHAHPPIATTFAAAGLPLDAAILQETVVMLGDVPVVPYAVPGSKDLAEGLVPFVSGHYAALLEHHGAVCWGDSIERALFRMESVEYYAKITMYTRLMGIGRPLTESQIDGLLELRPSWGIDRGGRPVGRKD